MNMILGLIGLALMGPVIAAAGKLPEHPAFARLDRYRPGNLAREERIRTGIVFGWLALSCLFGAIYVWSNTVRVRGEASGNLYPSYYDGPSGWLIALMMSIFGGAVYFVWRFFINMPKRDDHGSAELMNNNQLRKWEAESQGGGLVIGRNPLPKGGLLRYSGEAHLLTIAPTRSGKGVSGIIPNLLTYDGSVLVIDPKGENARVTARQRRSFGPTHILDPFGVTGLPAASYNPLRRITADNPDALDDAAALADALVVRGSGDDSHWDDEAASLIEGIILFVALHEAPDRRDLGTVREILTANEKDFGEILGIMKDCGGLVERTANRFESKSDREASGVLSSAQRHTKFLDSPRMLAVLGAAGALDFRELKRAKGTSIFLCIPPDRLDTYGRWLRLMVNEALLDMAAEPTKPEKPVLFLLDEFAALGALQSVKRAMGLMAGYGMILWPFLQDLGQLKEHYGEAASTFFANAGAVQFFGINDLETAKHVSETLGQETRTKYEGDSLQTFGRSLFNPDELMLMGPNHQLVLTKGKRPAGILKARYFSDVEFSGLWDADPRR